MTVIDAIIAKNEATQEAERHKNKEVEVAGIAQESAIKVQRQLRPWPLCMLSSAAGRTAGSTTRPTGRGTRRSR